MVKRSRIGTASTLAGDTDVINYVTTTPAWQYCSAPMPAPANGPSPLQIGPSSGFQRQVSRIFTLASPESVEVRRDGCDKIGSFLEHCFYCKEYIPENAEIFMYSEHAFCKTVCREIQMMLDIARERIAAKRKVVD